MQTTDFKKKGGDILKQNGNNIIYILKPIWKVIKINLYGRFRRNDTSELIFYNQKLING